jgi:peptide/nickel transport system ATP-binding protein
VLYAGRVVEHGKSAAILTEPRHPYTKGRLASLPKISGQRFRLQPIPGRLPDVRTALTGCVFAPRCHFAEPRCQDSAPVIGPVNDDVAASCWRAKELETTPWRVDNGEAIERRSRAAIEDASAIVVARDVERTFQAGSALDGLSVSMDGWKPRIRFGQSIVRAVDKVSLTIKVGEIVGLVGESGSGKTTLGRCLIDLISPTAGEVEFDGAQLLRVGRSEKRDLLKRAQIIFQNPDSSLNPRKSIGEILERPLELIGLGREARQLRVTELLELVRLDASYAARYPHQMSGGEKQRVGIARALSTNPRFIVCDEAVSALDVSVQASILNLLLDLRDRLDLSYLFITHDLSVVSYIADRICVMRHGKIVEVGATQAIIETPQHAYTRALLAAVPTIPRQRTAVPA